MDDLKELIRELHENNIEVSLGVVLNHTTEGNEEDPFLSFKGFDNAVYYMLTPDGKYYNFSGCGNTSNCAKSDYGLPPLLGNGIPSGWFSV